VAQPAMASTPESSPPSSSHRMTSFKLNQLEELRENLEGKLEDSERPNESGPKVVVTRKRKPSTLAHALSGMLGSVLAEMLLFPVDTVKLLVQTSAESTGFIETLIAVIRKQGVSGLYKGIGASVLKESVHSFNFWCWHGFIFRLFSKADDTSRTPTSARLLLNLLAKQLNWLCTVPFEVVSSRNQLALDSPGFIATALLLYRQGGLGVFYRGLGVSLALAINPAIMNTLITTILRCAASFRIASGVDWEDARDHGPAAIGAATALSKFVATLLTYPLIRAKVLQQTTQTTKNLSAIAIWRSIIQSEGLIGLYRGVLAMSYKTVLWNSLMMAFKSALGPSRAITPPATPPPPALSLGPLPLMAREPFPVDLITVEKLDQILSYLQHKHPDTISQERVQILESQMTEVSNEMREVKALLAELVVVAKTNRPEGPPPGASSSPGKRRDS